MDSRKALNRQAMAIMLVLCLVWGLQQVAVLKATVADIAPLFQIGLRSGVAAALVGLMMAARGERMRVSDGTWRPGMVVGLLFGLEFLLVAEGLRFTTAAHMVVFLYTAPIFVALGLHWKLPAERLAAVQWTGIALAFGGMVMAFFGREQPARLPTMLWGDFLALRAGMPGRHHSRGAHLPPGTRTGHEALLYQLGSLGLLMLVTIALGQTGFKPTPLVWGSLLFQSVVVSFASFLIWFWLLRHYLASRLGVVSFLTPLFGSPSVCGC